MALAVVWVTTTVSAAAVVAVFRFRAAVRLKQERLAVRVVAAVAALVRLVMEPVRAVKVTLAVLVPAETAVAGVVLERLATPTDCKRVEMDLATASRAVQLFMLAVAVVGILE